MRLSGSVKLRCARSGGPPSGARSGLPLFIMPEDGPGPLSSGGGFLASALSVALAARIDRKSTRLNSSHANISYAVFCLKKKKQAVAREQIDIDMLAAR